MRLKGPERCEQKKTTIHLSGASASVHAGGCRPAGTVAEISFGGFQSSLALNVMACFARRGDLTHSATTDTGYRNRERPSIVLAGPLGLTRPLLLWKTLEITPANVLALARRRVDLLENVELEERRRPPCAPPFDHLSDDTRIRNCGVIVPG